MAEYTPPKSIVEIEKEMIRRYFDSNNNNVDPTDVVILPPPNTVDVSKLFNPKEKGIQEYEYIKRQDLVDAMNSVKDIKRVEESAASVDRPSHKEYYSINELCKNLGLP